MLSGPSSPVLGFISHVPEYSAKLGVHFFNVAGSLDTKCTDTRNGTTNRSHRNTDGFAIFHDRLSHFLEPLLSLVEFLGHFISEPE